MKKLMVALTILAIASVAQAELLATWSTANNSGTVTAGANPDVVVSGLSLYGGAAQTGAASVWGMNSMVSGGGFQFSITSIAAPRTACLASLMMLIGHLLRVRRGRQ